MHDQDWALTNRERIGLALSLILGLLIALVACSSCAGQFSGQAPTKRDVSVGLLEVVGSARCTVWRADVNYLVTAGHCCKPTPELYVVHGPHAAPGADLKVLLDDDDSDVCVLTGPMLGPPLLLADRDPDVGERIWTRGYPLGNFVVSDGLWSGRGEDNVPVASIVIAHGGSGSPVLDIHGHVVGMEVLFVPGHDSIARMVPLEQIRDALRRAAAVH